jgi:hypothetical protein
MRRDAMPVQQASQHGPASVIVCADPFQLLIEPHQVRAARDDETLADMAPSTPGAWLCTVDDRAIPREFWHYRPPSGSVVQWRAIPQGGGKGGSNPLRAILQIAALVAINAVLPGAGFGTALLRGAAALAANTLINNLVPVSAGAPGGSPQYSAQAQGNLARLGQPIPEIFGFDNGYPELASQPYSLYVNNEQFLHVLLCVGVGQLHICRVSNGDTDLRNYDEVEIVRVGTGQSSMAGPGTGVETLAAQTLVDPRWVTNPDASLVELRPGDYAGPHTCCPPESTIDKIAIDVIQPQGMWDEFRMRWRSDARLTDDFDQPLGDWFMLGDHLITRRIKVPRTMSNEYAVPPGRYQVRHMRIDEIGRPLEEIEQLSVLAVRGHMVDADITVPDCTFVAIKIRATGQINGGLRFRVMSRRMLPVWDGATWSAPQLTRNPAWAIAHALRTRGKPDERIDLAQLLVLAPVWEARYDSFDYRFDTQISLWDALVMIAQVGRARPLIRGSRYTVVRDGPETLPVASYGMRNQRRGTMQLKPQLATSAQMRTLDLEYWDHRKWGWITVTAQIHAGAIYVYRGNAERVALGLPAPDGNRRGRIQVPGIIGENHARRTVFYMLADRYYRSADIEIGAEQDGQLPCPLNLVKYQHDVGEFGETGDVVNWTPGTLTLETSEPLGWGGDAASHALYLVRPTGAPTISMRATRGATDHHAVLDAADHAAAVAACTADQRGVFTVSFEDADRERTRYYFGPQTQVGAWCKVRSITASDERKFDLTLRLEDERVHTGDAPWIAPDPLPPCEVVIEEECLVLLQSRFLGGVATDESTFTRGDPVQNGGSISGGAFTVYNDNVANPFAVSSLTYPEFAPPGGDLTIEVIADWSSGSGEFLRINGFPEIAARALYMGWSTSVPGGVDIVLTPGPVEYNSPAAVPSDSHIVVEMRGDGTSIYVAGNEVMTAGAFNWDTHPIHMRMGLQGSNSGVSAYSIKGFRISNCAEYGGASSITPLTEFPPVT